MLHQLFIFESPQDFLAIFFCCWKTFAFLLLPKLEVKNRWIIKLEGHNCILLLLFLIKSTNYSSTLYTHYYYYYITYSLFLLNHGIKHLMVTRNIDGKDIVTL